jgi:AcrR family transcriptional regulator
MPESIQIDVVTRRARKKARTRRELYEAAIRLFLARGVEAVTVDEICAEADVARATFFLHFPTKHAVLQEYGRSVTGEVASAVAAHRGRATEVLRLVLDMLVERAMQHRAVMRVLLEETLHHAEALEEHAEQSRDLVALVAEVVRRGQAGGELRAGVDPRLAAAVIVSSYFAIAFAWIRGDEPVDLPAAVGQALELVLRGLGRSSRTRRR